MRSALTLLLMLVLSACQQQGREGDFYVFTDAQGNLVSMQRQPEQMAPGTEQGAAESVESDAQGVPQRLDDAQLDEVDEARYRSSDEVDAELEAKERDRFFSYVDESGQLVSRPLDMLAARQAREQAPADYQPVSDGPYLETYRAVRLDCCEALLDDATTLSRGKPITARFSKLTVTLDKTPFSAMVLRPDEDVTAVEMTAYIRNEGYLAAQLLWLDDKGVPVLLVDQPFERRYRETWMRYGYLQGTVPREQGQNYMVLFLPYQGQAPSTDGLTAVSTGDLVVTGR